MTVACCLTIAGCVATPPGGGAQASTVDCTYRLDTANASAGPELPNEKPLVNRSDRHEFVLAVERHVAWHSYSVGEGEDPDVTVGDLRSETVTDGVVVHVFDVEVGPTGVDDPAVFDDWSAHYYLDDTSIRRTVADVNETADPTNETVICL